MPAPAWTTAEFAVWDACNIVFSYILETVGLIFSGRKREGLPYDVSRQRYERFSVFRLFLLADSIKNNACSCVGNC